VYPSAASETRRNPPDCLSTIMNKKALVFALLLGAAVIAGVFAVKGRFLWTWGGSEDGGGRHAQPEDADLERFRRFVSNDGNAAVGALREMDEDWRPENAVMLVESLRLLGASRVYETGGRRFKSWNGDATVVDEEGQQWRLTEANLTSPSDQLLPRLPAHRSFWFGWLAAYPKTRLAAR
jgi:hypothetical protein